jgi:glycosyltransferase involved in cell wall biosynthesis
MAPTFPYRGWKPVGDRIPALTWPVKVAWVVKAWATGGAERMVLDLAPHFGDDVQLELFAARARPNDLVPVLERAGMQPRVLGAPWPRELRLAVAREGIDIVHTHGPYVGGIARLALVRSNTALVHTEHSVWSSHRLPTRVLNRVTIGRNRAVIAVSDAVAAEMGGRDVQVIRNGVDVDVVRSEAAGGVREPIAPSPRYVCVGHLRHRKGVDVLLRASLAIPDAQGIVAGDGEDAAQLRELCRELDAPVDLLGNRADARAITAAADVFVIPSRTEGTPLALLEAMALERPIVATAVGGLPELLTDELNALLVPPEDPPALAAAVVRLLNDRDLAERLGTAARATVEREASARATAAAYLDVYRSLSP